MRIIYITATLPFSAGAEDFFIPEVKELMGLGHQLLIVPRTSSGEICGEDSKALLGATHVASLLSFQIILYSVIELTLNPFRVMWVFNLILRSRNVETFLKNMAVCLKGLWLARVAKRWKADHIHAQWASTTATIGLVASVVSKIPWSFTAHRADIVQNNLLKEKTKEARFVRFISKSGFEMVRKLDVGKKACVIHMGVSLPDKLITVPPQKFRTTILCPANLIEIKGHHYLIEAMAILRKRGIRCNLLIAGQGVLRDALEKQIEDLSLAEHCKFLGQLTHDSLLSLYKDRKVGVVVLPSVDLGKGHHEGIPVSLIEAMSYGIPVISTVTGGIPELLDDGAGIMVPDKNIDALADALERLIKDDSLWLSLSSKGRKRVEDKFNAKRIASTIISYMRGIQ